MGQTLLLDRWSVARANVNIALIKYWGKAPAKHPDERNLPAVPSLSLTLDGLCTETRSRFAPELAADRVVLDNKPLDGEELARARVVIERFRREHELASPIDIYSTNHVPTAAGLASSASGMAALAVSLGGLVGMSPDDANDAERLSIWARLGSGSAARSLFPGWVAWDGPSARPVAPADHVPVSVVIAVVSDRRKAVASRDGMNQTAATSPYYGPWVASAFATFAMAEQALRDRDLPALFHAMRLSTWRMHASAMAADPPVCYWQPATLAVLREVDTMRDGDGWLVEATMDAGPNVKVFCTPDRAAAVAARLTAVPGVSHTLTTGPGSGPRVQPGDEA